MSSTDRHESYIFQNNYGTCYITSFLQILTCIDEFRVWATNDKIIKAICELTPNLMRPLTHKQFMSYAPGINPETIEDLQEPISPGDAEQINKEIYILRLCLLEILQLHCINVNDPIKKQIQDLNNWRKELKNRRTDVDFPEYNTPEIFYSLKRDIVDAPTTDNTTRILDQPYIDSIGRGGANDPTEEDAKTEFFYAINLRFHRLVAKLFSIRELFLPAVLKDDNLGGGDSTILLMLMLVQFNINADPRWDGKTNIDGTTLDDVPFSFPWKLSSNPDGTNFLPSLIEDILIKGMSNTNTPISGFEKSDLYDLFSFEEEHKLYKIQMQTAANPNPEMFEITEEETKAYQIKQFFNKGRQPADPDFKDNWRLRNKKEDQIIYEILDRIPEDESSPDAYKYKSLNSNDKDINDIIGNYVYSYKHFYDNLSKRKAAALLTLGTTNTQFETTNPIAVGKKANPDPLENAKDIPGGNEYQFSNSSLEDTTKPEWKDFKLVTFNKITRAPRKYFFVKPGIDKMKITEYLTINDGTENHYKLIAASVSAGDDHDNAVSTTCKMGHAVALVWVNGTGLNPGRWVEFNDNSGVPIVGDPSRDSSGNVVPAAQATNDNYVQKFNGYSYDYGKYLHDTRPLVDIEKILIEHEDPNDSSSRVYRLKSSFKLQSRKKGEEATGHLKWVGGAQTSVSLSKPWYFYNPSGNLFLPYTRVMPRSYANTDPIPFPNKGLNFASKPASFLIYEKVSNRENENIVWDTIPPIKSGVIHFKLGPGGIPVSAPLVPPLGPGGIPINIPLGPPGVPGATPIKIPKSIDLKNKKQAKEIATLINYILTELERFRNYMLESNFISQLFRSHGYQKHFQRNTMVYTKMNRGSKFFSDSIINFFFKIAGFNKLNKSYVRII